MPRYRLLIEYDGGPFKGWQSQANGASVQTALQEAVEAFSGQKVQVFGAGRTDTGVHATGQAAHIDLEKDWPARTVREAINANLTRLPVVVIEAALADPEFHARFSAVGRRYLYRVLNREAPPALDRGRVFWVRKPLDAAAMHEAAQALVGLHDFTTFRDAQCQAKSPVKTLDLARVWREGDEVRLEFAARSFLHRQVRSMTGTLVQVGLGRWRVGDVAEALAAADRTRCGTVAPPQGLYLTKVEY
ncbi:MAG: tRNA pseudouridine(38-40) synthase TruA [Proteobacteria bacterium]|nr:tRNA pseudouridine(38-40) synthase TruA [Pseudomonadota bacterium]